MANPQSWNRYSYVTNRPVSFNDPTGHMIDDGCRTSGCGGQIDTKKYPCADLHGLVLDICRYGERNNSKKGVRELLDPILPDARYRSLSTLVGINEDLFINAGGSLVYVPSRKELAFYYWYKSSAMPNEPTRDAFGLLDDNLVVSPQAGVSYISGLLWGEDFDNNGVQTFEGDSYAIDVSAPVTGSPLGANLEFLNSLGEDGKPNQSYFALGGGPTFGKPSVTYSSVSTTVPVGQTTVVTGLQAQVLNFLSYLVFK